MNNLPEIERLFKRLKKAHELYESYRDYQDKLEEIEIKVEPLLKELENLGVGRGLSTALLIFGGKAKQLSSEVETESTKELEKKKAEIEFKLKHLKGTPVYAEKLKEYEGVCNRLGVKKDARYTVKV